MLSQASTTDLARAVHFTFPFVQQHNNKNRGHNMAFRDHNNSC